MKTDHKAYFVGDKMRVEVQLTNVGTEGVYVRRSDLCSGSPLASALTIGVLDPSGRVVPGVIFDCLSPPPPPPEPGKTSCDVTEYILMAPSNFFGFSQEFNVTDFVDRPGDYIFVVQYHSFTPRDLVPTPLIYPLPYWTKENEPLVSKLHISIKPRQHQGPR